MTCRILAARFSLSIVSPGSNIRICSVMWTMIALSCWTISEVAVVSSELEIAEKS